MIITLQANFRSSVASRTRSQVADSILTLHEQNLLKDPSKEACSFDNADIAALQTSGAFPAGAIIRPFDREVRADFCSDEWVCFFAYPFSIGIRYPFPAFISHFFELTSLSYAQTMPMVWRVLVTLDQIKARHLPDLCIEDLPIAYRLRSHGSSRFLLFSTSKDPFILKATKNEDDWRRKFFFVKRDSIDKGHDLPKKWLTPANFKELAPPSAESEGRIKEIYQLPESERTFTLIFKSSSHKSSSDMSTVTSKPTSSKATVFLKPSTASKPSGSSSRKRKEHDSPAASDVFPFENHGFSESNKFMTSFLNQGVERLVFLCEDSCGLNRMLEGKLRKAEITIADQAAIATAKLEHYEAKYKAITQVHRAAIKKITHEAQAKSDAAQVENGHEDKALGFECPSWNVEAWEVKLRDLGGNPVEHPSKPVVEEPSKAGEIVTDAGGDAEKDVGADLGPGAGGDMT
ncbi:hypothetical protein Hanom_Chr08g00723371 [Helianthus anomalus]